MNITHRHGHTQASPGTRDVLDELSEVTIINKRVAQLLSPFNTMTDVTPSENYSYPKELNTGIDSANNASADLFFSLHMNSSSKKDANGSEVWVYPGDSKTINLGNRILRNLSELGFYNRGVKGDNNEDYGEIQRIDYSSMIIEICFVFKKDAEVYKRVGVDAISRAIANGIDNRVSFSTTPLKPQAEMHRNIVIYNTGSDADKSSAEYFAMVLNSANEDCVVVDYQEYRKSLVEGRSIFAVGGSLKGKFKYHKIFVGEDRYKTAASVLQYLKSKY